MDIIFRTAIALAVSAAGVSAYALLSRAALRRAHSRLLGLEEARPGLPILLYFTTPTCAPCRTVQGPAIQSLQKIHGAAVQVIKIDAQARPDVADHWGVLSVPTTFVFDVAGTPRFMNSGVAGADKLERQLIEAGLKRSAIEKTETTEKLKTTVHSL